MADPDEALIEAIAEAIHVERSGKHDSLTLARAAQAAVIKELGLVEERAREIGPSVNRPMRRLVSRWTEVDHGCE